MILLKSFITSGVLVNVYHTEHTIIDVPVYCITTHHVKSDKFLVRFGTKNQINSILKTYKNMDTENILL